MYMKVNKKKIVMKCEWYYLLEFQRNQHLKPSTEKLGKEVTMEEDFYDVLICGVKSIIEFGITDFGASIHASIFREVTHNFKHYIGKVRLAYNKILDITRVGNVALNAILGSKWILKNVKYISDLKRC